MASYATSLPKEKIAHYATETPPWGPIGYIVYKRTYARPVEGENRKEEWWETVWRCCNGIVEIGGLFTEDELLRLYDHVFYLRGCFAGRSLWQLGTDTVRKNGLDSLQNCWHVAIDDPVESFCFVFNELMLGGGVGFNILPEIVYEMPKVKYDVSVSRVDERDVYFIVPDNREGWVELLRKTLRAFYFDGKDFTFSTICVRGKGAPIKGFGGVASGPEDLCRGIDQIVKVLKGRVGKKLRPVDCLDICNIIGSVVVAGNVRRSAQIAIGACKDQKFLEAKNWGKGAIPNWRGMSNNTVVCDDISKLDKRYWSTYEGDSEAYGLFNYELSRNHGRLVDGHGYRKDPDIVGPNPCGEIILANKEACNLLEIFLPNIRSEDEFKDVAELLFKCGKAISTVPASDPETAKIVGKNHRIGVGITGFYQASKDLRKQGVLTKVYRHLEKVDKQYSRELGVKESIKLTTVKPSGTLSLLPGVTPGCHPAFSRYYIRRVRMAADDPLVEVCKEHGYNVEPQMNQDGSRSMETMVVGFPVAVPEGTKVSAEVDAIEQLETAAYLQKYWSDNSVSVTVYYKKEELPRIQEWLKEYWSERLKTISFCLHSGHGFLQAPHEEIGKETYEALVAKAKPITSLESDVGGDLEGLGCDGGHCPIK